MWLMHKSVVTIKLGWIHLTHDTDIANSVPYRQYHGLPRYTVVRCFVTCCTFWCLYPRTRSKGGWMHRRTGTDLLFKRITAGPTQHLRSLLKYEGRNFNFGNDAVTFDTAHLQSSYFHRPSMYSPKLCRTRSQRWGSRMIPLAAPVLLMVRTERSTAEGLNTTCNCPIR